MRCGAKCFLVKIDVDEAKLIQPVVARTSAEARKRIRQEFEGKVQIISVREEKKKR